MINILISGKFNFRFNISYGKVDANDSEVINSAIAAEIHDRIMKFPDLYDTQVSVNCLKVMF